MQLMPFLRMLVRRAALPGFFGIFMGAVFANEVTLSMQSYTDSSTTILVPALGLRLGLWTGGTLAASVKYDVISAASEQRSTTADVVSGATSREGRFMTTLNLTQLAGLWNFRIGGYFSHEPDYGAMAVSFEVSRELFEKNTTLSLSGSYGADTITSIDDPLFHETASRYSVSVGVSQILSPKLIAKVSGSYSRVQGYQSNPYRFALRDAAFPAFDNTEKLPDDHNRYVLAFRVNWYLVPIRGALHAGYRFYDDDWGVTSHELFSRLYKYFSDQLVANLQLRFHTQTGADFYKAVFTQAESYMTSFEKYAPGNTVLVSIGAQYTLKIDQASILAFLDGMRFNGEVGAYRRSADANTGLIGQVAVTWKW